ncbi:aldehyde dehydrogenase, partial [Aduncisulcus paluster]
PWNFPVAIALGGIAAVLAAGNTVIIKPASVAALTAYELCKCFWDAGISKSILQFTPCPGALAGEHLISNKDVDFVILTGGEDTAISMLNSRPNLFLTAETGGKDATIVTNMSDREQAVKNVCQSAFGNSGQKCSATSLLVLEEEVYNDVNFKKALVDAASSMNVGSVWNFKNRIGTLANSVFGNLKKAIEQLEGNEEWALKPSFAENNEYMLKPAIKWGVEEGNFIHKNELFGPVLAVMKAKNLELAVDIVNSTGYGLTSGIESLDEREVSYWKENLKAGNLYVNRGTTGAIVLRQPFGGMGKSAIGAGRKVGIHNYITQFVDFK